MYDFPNSPTIGQVFGNYTWDGQKWTQTPSSIAGTALPLMNGTATVGTSTNFSREDHIHPSDTSRAPLNSPAFTGDPKAPTPLAGDNDTSVATTAFVSSAVTTGTAAMWRSIKTQTFTSSGTYTPSQGMINCIVECYGGGGGGGGTNAATAQAAVGGGGGGGGYSRSCLSAAAVGASKAVSVGNGGASSGGPGAGGAGGSTTFGGTLCVANGGSGGGGSAFSQAATLGGVPGTGNVIAAPGPNAHTAGGDITSAQSITLGGGGASTALGGGGEGGRSNSGGTNGSNATGFAAGAGGGSCNQSSIPTQGGAGAPGICVVTEYCSQ